DGMFDSHHGVIAQMLLDQVAFLDQRITAMEDQAIAALAQVQESWGVDAAGETGPGRGAGPDSQVLAAAYRLAEIPGVSVWLAIVIIAEIGLNMAAFPTPAHLVSWIGLCRSATQSGARHGKGKQKKGNSYARAAAGQAAIGTAGTATFLGERYRRIARRRGGAIAQVAVARSIMIIVWHLLNDPADRYRDLGPDWHADHDTAEFAVAAIRAWWRKAAASAYPGATRLLICADGGGSNGYRTRLWKTGLTVSAELDTAAYPKGIKISDRQMKDLEQRALRRHQFHGEWNYALIPAHDP
ncbi:MAG: ISAzo13-like element transposase-related protein, partial [Streptosporangiaceae bacterium]